MNRPNISQAEFADQVADAYEHLYDLIYLRTHPLAEFLVPDHGLSRKDRAWHLHRTLIDAIEELDPGMQAPVLSREWRRYRLMVLRFTEGLDTRSVANQLSISPRHYYRECKSAIEAIASLLWERHATPPSAPRQIDQHNEEPAPASQLELLRLEAARLAQANRYARVSDVVEGVLRLLHELLEQRRIDVRLSLPDGLPDVSVEKDLLRQILVGILGYRVASTVRAALRLAAQTRESVVSLLVRIEPSEAIQPAKQAEMEDQVLALMEMATLSNARILLVHDGDSIAGFDIQLPTVERTVLVVDDNEDVLHLFRRYLSPHHYHVVTAQTARKALNRANQLQPYAITLDLMMPDQDGWDLLQVLLNEPRTRHIPIIVCSVLKQKKLALSLGATAFLEKPVTEQTLLSALEMLGET